MFTKLVSLLYLKQYMYAYMYSKQPNFDVQLNRFTQ